MSPTVHALYVVAYATPQHEHVRSERAPTLLLPLLYRSEPDVEPRPLASTPPRTTGRRKAKALNQTPPGLSMEECELRALAGDRGYIPPTWYLATPPGTAVLPEHAIILHKCDADTQSPLQNGNSSSTWCGRRRNTMPNRAFRPTDPPRTAVSERPSWRRTPTTPRGRRTSRYLTIKSSWPHLLAQAYGPWNQHN